MSLDETKAYWGSKVRDEIRPQSKWLLVAEAPGVKEELEGLPLVGPTGQMTNEMLAKMELHRQRFDLTNVLKYRPDDNNLMAWIEHKHPAIEEGVRELLQLVHSGKYDYILCLGWFSLFILTGKKGIREHRGSVYPLAYRTPAGEDRVAYVMGTHHPASIFHAAKDETGEAVGPGALANIIFRDLARFKRMTLNGPPKKRERQLVLFPEAHDIEMFWQAAIKADFMACDIEADSETKEITEVGFALGPDYAICIPTFYDGAPVANNVEWVQRLLALPTDKVWHNASFDLPFIAFTKGWKVCGEQHDTLLMHHVCFPELPADLGFCVSIYTDEPYFKDLGRSRGNDAGSLEEFYRYNAMDAATTAEIVPVLRKKLAQLGVEEVYERDRRMLPIANAMSLRGIRFDAERAERMSARLEHNLMRWQRLLDTRAGWAVNPYSTTQARKLLYDQLLLPIQYEKDKKTGKNKITTKQTKLLNLYPTVKNKHKRAVLRAFLHVRRLRKLRSSYLKKRPDGTYKLASPRDGRIRTSLRPGAAETGRWTAGTFLIDMEGTNGQTHPPEFKPALCADEGKVLAIFDYAQIEAQLVAYDAEDAYQIGVFESGGDIHVANAARLLSIPLAQVTTFQRQYIGKSTHALNYDVGAETLAEFTNKKGLETGIFISVDFAKQAKRLYQEQSPAAHRWKERQWRDGKKHKFLVNHLGRKRIFLGPTKGQFAYLTRGKMIAFVPQSDVPDMLNIAMYRIAYDPFLQQHGVELLLQVHDAVATQGDAATVDQWIPRILQHMHIPLTIRGRTCIVRTDCKYGTHWDNNMKKWKAPSV